MVLPTTYLSSLLLLLLALGCLSFWPNLYRTSEAGWRFELFSLDFALGAFLFAILAAYTLGMLGPAISFTDRMLVAGRSAEIWIIGAGMIFIFGNMLLLASITLLGMAVAFPLVFGTAILAVALLHLDVLHPALPWTTILLMLLAIWLAFRANQGRVAATKKSLPRNRQNAHIKGAILAVLGGAAIGGVQAILRLISDPEFGPGPYATLLMLSIGILVATPALNFFFMNIKITGDPIQFRSYGLGGIRQHTAGVVSGVIWALGALSVMLAMSVTGDQAPNPATVLIVPFLFVAVCALLGRFRWKEFSLAPAGSRLWLGLSVFAFVAGLAVLGAALPS